MQGYGVLEFFDYIRENRATINSEDDLWKNARELDSEGQRDLLEFMRLICEGVFCTAANSEFVYDLLMIVSKNNRAGRSDTSPRLAS